MRGINHLVIAGRNLDAMRTLYERLGFTLTARGQHPFGTGNTIIQLHGAYIELLSVTRPPDVVEHRPGQFSFGAFNRDFLARREGFSMLVFDSKDARADIADWLEAGLETYAPVDFSRSARMPSGEEVTVGFSLAFVTHPAAPWLGTFACQHYRPEYYAQQQFLAHANRAYRVEDVWIVGTNIESLQKFFGTLILESPAMGDLGESIFAIPSGRVILASPSAFERVFGCAAPYVADGPHLAGLTIGCEGLEALPVSILQDVGARYVLSPNRGFGTALAFTGPAKA
jgi:catechol 2,3-dioxygenase-like lactoylglutathione lyase family enzyme